MRISETTIRDRHEARLGRRPHTVRLASLFRYRNACLIGSLVAALGSLGAQAPSQPSALFGALPFPNPDVVNEFGLVLDRFTNDSKLSDLDPSQPRPRACDSIGHAVGRTCRYQLDRVIGFSSVYGTFSYRLRGARGVLSLSPMLGYTGNQPSEFFQNNFLHNRESLDDVRWSEGKVYNSVQMALYPQLNVWSSPRVRMRGIEVAVPAFIGAGGGIGTITNEMYAQAGVRNLTVLTKGRPVISFSGMLRNSLFVRRGFVLTERRGLEDSTTGAGGVYPAGTVARNYRILAGSMRIPLDTWLPYAGILPAIELGVSTSGFFLLRDQNRDAVVAEGRQDRANELFRTIALTWLNGDFGIETWNDSPGGKDQGPSYGARVFVRWRPESP